MTQMIVYEFTDTLLIPERSFACLPALRDRKAMSRDDSGLHCLNVRPAGSVCSTQLSARQQLADSCFLRLNHSSSLYCLTDT